MLDSVRRGLRTLSGSSATKMLDDVGRCLPGEDIRYVFLGSTAVPPALAPIVVFLDFIQIGLPGAHKPRIIAITRHEIIVMRGGTWSARSRRKPKQVLYRLSRRPLGPLANRASSVITIGEERIRVKRSAYSFIERANAELEQRS